MALCTMTPSNSLLGLQHLAHAFELFKHHKYTKYANTKHAQDIMARTTSKSNSSMRHSCVHYVFLDSLPTKEPFLINTHLVLQTITTALFSFN